MQLNPRIAIDKMQIRENERSHFKKYYGKKLNQIQCEMEERSAASERTAKLSLLL